MYYSSYLFFVCLSVSFHARERAWPPRPSLSTACLSAPAPRTLILMTAVASKVSCLRGGKHSQSFFEVRTSAFLSPGLLGKNQRGEDCGTEGQVGRLEA